MEADLDKILQVFNVHSVVPVGTSANSQVLEGTKRKIIGFPTGDDVVNARPPLPDLLPEHGEQFLVCEFHRAIGGIY
jgi:hypothetical protein